MSDDSKPHRRPWMVAMLVTLPLWLFVSAGLGLWKYYSDSEKSEVVEPSKFATPIDTKRVADDMRKLVEIVGPRNLSSEQGARGIRRAAAMIQGALGPGNAGYRLELENGPKTSFGEWPIILATLPGGSSQPLWVVVGYDTIGRGIEANSSGVASALAVARSVAGESPSRPIKFAFLPHVYDPSGPTLALLDGIVPELGKPDLVLVVEAMGAKGELMISSRDAEVLVNPVFEKHGTVVGAEAVCLEDDFDLCSTLFELDLPAVRVATRRIVGESEEEVDLPHPEQHGSATRALADLVMDLAG